MNWISAPFVWLARGMVSFVEGVWKGISHKVLRAYRFQKVEELPDRLKPFAVYVVGEGENVWAASMICPCGCKEVIELNLLPQVRPRWAVSLHPDGSVSLHPSVWRQKGCRSHFILSNGQILWCDT